MDIPLYTWSERSMGVVEIHSPRLFSFFKTEGVTLVERLWQGQPTPDLFSTFGERGLVSISRTHWAALGPSHWIIDRIGYESWARQGQKGFYAVPQPDNHKIAVLATACRKHGHLPFSRDQAMCNDGYLHYFEQLRFELVDFLAELRRK